MSKEAEMHDKILNCLANSQYERYFQLKGYDRILKQVDLICDPALSQDSIREIEFGLQWEVSSKLSVVIYRKSLLD